MKSRNRINIFAAITLLAALCVSGCSQNPAKKRDKLIASGQAYFSKEDYSAAAIQFRRAIQIDPTSSAAHYQLGLASLRLHNWADAYRSFTRAGEFDPKNVNAFLQKGELELLTKQWPEATASAESALRANPDFAPVHLLLGRIAFQRHEIPSAREHFQRAAELAPSDPSTYSELADAYAADSLPYAERLYNRAIEVDATYYPAYLNLFQLYRRTKDTPKQVETLQRAIQQNPKQVTAYLLLADLYVQQGHKEQLDSVFTDLRSKTGDASFALLAIGNYLSVTGEVQQAEAVLAHAMEKDPKSVDVRKRLIQVKAALQKWDEVSALNAELLRQNPRDPDGRLVAAKLQLFRGDRGQAINSLEQLVRDVPELAPAHLTLGLAYGNEGQLNPAIAEVGECLKRDPEMLIGYLVLSEMHLRQGDAKAAVEDAETLLKRRPGLLAARFARATAEIVLGNLAPAKQELQELLKVQPTNAALHERLAFVDMQQKAFNEAEKHFEEALRIRPDFYPAMANLAEMYRLQGRSDRIVARVNEQISRVPAQSYLYELLATAYLLNKDLDNAEAALHRAIQLEPSSYAAHLKLAEIYASQQKTEAAIAEADSVRRLRPDVVAAHILSGSLYQKAGAVEKSRQAYTEAIERDPGNAVALNNLAWLYCETGGNLDLALSLAQKAKENAPQNPSISDTLGWIQFRKQMYALAAAQFESAVRVAPAQGVYHYHLGLAKMKVGKPAEARSSFKRALELQLPPNDAASAREALSGIGG
jgi:tetratricopeptide (TPR) repeat protein